MSRVDAIVVNYNTRNLLAACVDSLLAQRRAREIDRIIVVDSSSDDGSAELIQTGYPDVDVMIVPNRGYGAAANAGMTASNADFYFILNADTVIPAGIASTLAGVLETNPKVAVAGPRLRLPDGDIQPSRRRFPGRLTPLFESTIVQEWWLSNPWTRRYYVEDWPEGRAQVVDWVVGAAMMVRASAVEQAGGFDESFRMFAEETEWAYRLRRNGWRTLYVPSAEVTHIGGASTSQDVPRRQLDFDASRVELHRRLYGPLMATIVAGGLRVNYLAHIARESVKWLIGHRRELRTERIRIYARCLSTGFQRDD